MSKIEHTSRVCENADRQDESALLLPSTARDISLHNTPKARKNTCKHQEYISCTCVHYLKALKPVLNLVHVQSGLTIVGAAAATTAMRHVRTSNYSFLKKVSAHDIMYVKRCDEFNGMIFKLICCCYMPQHRI